MPVLIRVVRLKSEEITVIFRAYASKWLKINLLRPPLSQIEKPRGGKQEGLNKKDYKLVTHV